VGDGPELNVVNVLLAALPLVALLASILALKWSAPRAGAAAFLVVAVIALLFFGSDPRLLAIGSAKGLSLSLFVLSIIWTSVLLYNVVDEMGGIDVIGRTMTRLVEDPLAQALVVGWAFSGFMQGIAGFGVPVAVVAPLMVFMGFGAARAAAIVLVGHAWAVTFGSLGSSYFTIQLVTDIPGEEIGPHMAALFALPTIATGFAVAHLEGGMPSLRRGIPIVLVMGGSMALCLWVLASVGAPQVASLVSGLVGCGVGWLVAKTPLLRAPAKEPAQRAEPSEARDGPGFHMAFLPYYAVLALSVLSQVPAVKEIVAVGVMQHNGTTAFAPLSGGLDYPATETGAGYAVKSEDSYAKIRLLRHPAPLILLSLALTYGVFLARQRWKPGAGLSAIRKTYTQCVPTSVGIATMVMMALVMTDTGMTVLLGRTIADITQTAFPVFSPYIGVLGTFMTGSNTNSNVMFGVLQQETAGALGVSAVTIAAVQSIGGSLGSAIAPAKVLVGTAIVGLSGKEGEVMKRTIPYCLLIVLLVGIQAWIVLNLF
jgi:lactate permease